MKPMMHERVRNLFVKAGLTSGFTVQQLMYDDPGKLSEAVMVFRPNGGTNIRNELGSEYHVIVDVIGAKGVGAKDKALNAVQRITDYVQANPISDSCVGHIENMGGIPPPVLTEEGRIVFRLQFACLYGE